MTDERGDLGTRLLRESPQNGLAVRTRRTAGNGAVCELAGELDIESRGAAALAVDELVAERPALLVVDLGGVAFCDSSGLNLLLRARLDATAAGIDFRIANPTPAVTRILQLTGTDTVFTMHTGDEAVLGAAG